jgi:hypothetical protein
MTTTSAQAPALAPLLGTLVVGALAVLPIRSVR